MENIFKVFRCLKTVDSLTLLHPPIISEVMKELRSPFLRCRSEPSPVYQIHNMDIPSRRSSCSLCDTQHMKFTAIDIAGQVYL